jgi:hypothetical protein
MVSFSVKINEEMHKIEDVDGNLLVGEIKTRVEMISSLPKINQKWVYKGRMLTDQMTITEIGVTDGDTIIIMRTAAAAIPQSQPSPTPVGTPVNSNAVRVLTVYVKE